MIMKSTASLPTSRRTLGSVVVWRGAGRSGRPPVRKDRRPSGQCTPSYPHLYTHIHISNEVQTWSGKFSNIERVLAVAISV